MHIIREKHNDPEICYYDQSINGANVDGGE